MARKGKREGNRANALHARRSPARGKGGDTSTRRICDARLRYSPQRLPLRSVPNYAPSTPTLYDLIAARGMQLVSLPLPSPFSLFTPSSLFSTRGTKIEIIANFLKPKENDSTIFKFDFELSSNDFMKGYNELERFKFAPKATGASRETTGAAAKN